MLKQLLNAETMDFDLQRKLALVTGVGSQKCSFRSIVMALAKKGYDIVKVK